MFYYLKDYKDEAFRKMFVKYFAEFGFKLSENDSIFEQMGQDESLKTLLLKEEGQLVGLIMCCVHEMNGFFLKKKDGFIREMYIDIPFRKKGFGEMLLRKAEEELKKDQITTVVLTSDTAVSFFEKRGYQRNPAYKANNDIDVYEKWLFN